MRLLIVLLAQLPLPAFAQAPGTATIACTPPTTNTNGTPITGAVITYKFYHGTVQGTYPNVSPVQTSCAYVWPALAAGTHYFTATATVAGVESALSMSASKTILPTPNPPTNITVTSTRIEPSSWTCRDVSGSVLTSHERADKAQESCTNFALASLGTPFEMRPSGFRIVAR